MRELQNFINENINLNSPESLSNLFSVFEKLTDLTQPQNIRRAAFLGYSTIAKISSEKKIEHNTAIFCYIIKNIISNFKDNDNRIVYSSAESLYNLLKYIDQDIMIHFNSIFEGLLLIKVNQEQDVKLISENIDSLLKESINFIFQDNRLSQSVDLKEFFRNIYEKLDSKHPEIKVLIVSWIMFINSIPEVKIINVLHEFLPNLFSYLADNNKEVNNAAENCLREIKNELESFFENLNYEEEVQILEILIQQALSKNDRIKLTTFKWLDMFLDKYKYLFIQSSKLKSSYPKTISFMTLQSKNAENNNNINNTNVIINSNFNNFKYYQNLNITNASNSSISNIFGHNPLNSHLNNNSKNINNNNANATFCKTPASQKNISNNNSSLNNSNLFSFNNNASNNGNNNNNRNNQQQNPLNNESIGNPITEINKKNNNNNNNTNKDGYSNLNSNQNGISPELNFSLLNNNNNISSNNISNLNINNPNLSNINPNTNFSNDFVNTDNSSKNALIIIEEKNAEANMSNLDINSENNNSNILNSKNILNSNSHPIKNVSPVLNLNLTGNIGNNSFAENTPKTNEKLNNNDASLISIQSNSNRMELIQEKELAKNLTPSLGKAKNENLISDENINNNNKNNMTVNEIYKADVEFNSLASVSKKHSVDETTNRKPVETISGDQVNKIISQATTVKNSDDTIIDSIRQGNDLNFKTSLKSNNENNSNAACEANKNNNLNKQENLNSHIAFDSKKNNKISNDTFNPTKNQNSFLEGVNFIILNLEKDPGERKIPFHLFPKILEILIDSINSEDLNFEIDKLSDECNITLHSILHFYSDQNTCNIKLFEFILKKYFKVKNDLILKKVLVWISKLFEKFHEEMFIEINSFIDNFADLLTRENDSVFCSVLEILCEISKYKDEYIEIIIRQILEKLALNLFLLQNRATKIIKNFCKIIEVNRVYLTFAEELKNMKDEEFIGKMINILDIFLLKSDEAYKLRNYLKNLRKSKKSFKFPNKETAMHDYYSEDNFFGTSTEEKDKKKRNIFEILFSTWALNPISCINLCFLCEYYELSYHIIQKLGLIKLSDDNYIQLAELVQSLESYNFVNLRIYLLQPKLNKFLVKSLYGILLMIPQGKAYQALYKRLSHMNMILKLDNYCKEKSNTENEGFDDNQDELSFYLKIFEKIHLKKRLRHISSQDVKFGNQDDDEIYEEENDENVERFYLYENMQEEELHA